MCVPHAVMMHECFEGVPRFVPPKAKWRAPRRAPYRGCRLPVAGCRSPVVGCRFPCSVTRFPGCKLSAVPRHTRTTLLPFVGLVLLIVAAGLWLLQPRMAPARRTLLEPPGRAQQAVHSRQRRHAGQRSPRHAGRHRRSARSPTAGAWPSAPTSRAPRCCAPTPSRSWTSPPPHASRRYPPRGTKDPSFGTGTYMGVAFAPDGRSLFYSNANEGQILRLDLASGTVDRHDRHRRQRRRGQLRRRLRAHARRTDDRRRRPVQLPPRHRGRARAARCGSRCASAGIRSRWRCRPTSGRPGCPTSGCSSTRCCRA